MLFGYLWCVGFSKSKWIVFNLFDRCLAFLLRIGILGWLLLRVLYVLFEWKICRFPIMPMRFVVDGGLASPYGIMWAPGGWTLHTIYELT